MSATAGLSSVPLWPFGLYFLIVIFLAAAMLGLSSILGQRHLERATGIPYEGGILPEGSARVRLSAKFYLLAMFFVIFDLESIFIYAWAVAARELGWAAYGVIAIFIGVLLAVLGYLWRSGGLDWASIRRHTL
jgi:NADH-quinone oxidoreductase subunit A